MNTVKISSVSACVLVGVLCLFGYKEHSERLDEKLVHIVKSGIAELPIPASSRPIYRQVSANRHCNKSEITLVFSSHLSPKDICTQIQSSLLPSKWESVQSCDIAERVDRGFPSYHYQKLNALDVSKTFRLELKAYPAAAFPQFWPVNEYAELDIILAARKPGIPFYYINLSYRGPYDSRRYPCNEAQFECKCAYTTYYSSTISELKETP